MTTPSDYAQLAQRLREAATTKSSTYALANLALEAATAVLALEAQQADLVLALRRYADRSNDDFQAAINEHVECNQIAVNALDALTKEPRE